jgi:hypothetical protein
MAEGEACPSLNAYILAKISMARGVWKRAAKKNIFGGLLRKERLYRAIRGGQRERSPDLRAH